MGFRERLTNKRTVHTLTASLATLAFLTTNKTYNESPESLKIDHEAHFAAGAILANAIGIVGVKLAQRTAIED